MPKESLPQLLATKILVPRSVPGLIERPRLPSLAARVQARPWSIVKGAAGFGKTSLRVSSAESLRPWHKSDRLDCARCREQRADAISLLFVARLAAGALVHLKVLPSGSRFNNNSSEFGELNSAVEPSPITFARCGSSLRRADFGDGEVMACGFTETWTRSLSL